MDSLFCMMHSVKHPYKQMFLVLINGCNLYTFKYYMLLNIYGKIRILKSENIIYSLKFEFIGTSYIKVHLSNAENEILCIWLF